MLSMIQFLKWNVPPCFFEEYFENVIVAKVSLFLEIYMVELGFFLILCNQSKTAKK